MPPAAESAPDASKYQSLKELTPQNTGIGTWLLQVAEAPRIWEYSYTYNGKQVKRQTVRGHACVAGRKRVLHRLRPPQARQPHRQREIHRSRADSSVQERVGGQQGHFGEREALLYQQPLEAPDQPERLKDDTGAPEHIQDAI